MQFDMRTQIKDFEGEPIERKEVVNKRLPVDDKNIKWLPYTLRDAISIALNADVKDEISTPEDKSKIYQLCNKLFATQKPDLTVDDIHFILERSAKVHNPLINGRVKDLLNIDKKKEE